MVRLPVRENVPETGSKTWAIGPANQPAATSTFPSERSVAVGRQMPDARLPVAWNFSEPGSYISALVPRKSHSDGFKVVNTLPLVRSVAVAPTSPPGQSVARNIRLAGS